jgi:hypothetical protein
VKTVAKLEAVKMGLLSEPGDILELVNAPANGDVFSMEPALDHYAELNDTAEAVKSADDVWRRDGGINYEHEFDELEDDNRISIGDLVAQGLVELQEPSTELVAVLEEINCGVD